MNTIMSSRPALAVAGALGATVRRARLAQATLAEVAGVALISYGLGTAWRPLGFLAVGAALVAVAWRRA